ncbi:MAG: ammonium transporter [Opitutales bacterium]|nr:ammonium transporter [Opitutales bacterium]
MGKTIFTLAAMLAAPCAFAEGPAKVSAEMFTVNNLWILLGAVLVFAMHPGFALVETGLCRAKNSVNILAKNVLTVAIGLLTYSAIGFSLMYPRDSWLLNGFLGFAGFGVASPEGAAGAIAYNGGNYAYWTDFIFQGMFAATSVTIVSGAVAERIKFGSYLIFAVIYAALGYTIIGSWGWGGGWLSKLGFYDLAGSTFVHSVGGWAALVGAIMVGPRMGKYVNGKAHAIPGSNLGFATLGVFLLWFGWFGFNGASVFSADPVAVAYVFTTTALSAAAGLVAAMATSWLVQGKPDLSMILNGCLAGLVGITASADCVSIPSSIAIGLISGVVVVLSVYFFDKLQIDDPVGALSVHLVCGVWGTLAVGIFSPAHRILPQIVGILAVAAASLSASFAIFYALKRTAGLRVGRNEELKGLDISEHAMEAYSGFQIFSNE